MALFLRKAMTVSEVAELLGKAAELSCIEEDLQDQRLVKYTYIMPKRQLGKVLVYLLCHALQLLHTSFFILEDRRCQQHSPFV